MPTLHRTFWVSSADSFVSHKNMNSYQDKARDILANADRYHQAYYEAGVFRGPSLYFHRRALETGQPPGRLTHLEYVYAMLASWGMHRMGVGGSKMQTFDTFRSSVESLYEKISEAQRFELREMNDQNWAVLKDIFQGIKVMASETSLVGNSKVMHHMLPHIAPPIDRQYTLRYLRGSTGIKNGIDREWELMEGIISGFFIPVVSDEDFLYRVREWVAAQDKYPWDTSVLKVVDNLVIGSMK